MTTITDALNREYAYTFDEINQTKTWIFPDESAESYDYDANGDLTQLTRRSGHSIGFIYDAAGRLTAKTWNTPGNINFLYSTGRKASGGFDVCRTHRLPAHAR